MNYPVWQFGIPGGLLIAFVAVLHVFVSHFAVGGGAFLVLTERKARRRNDPQLLDYVRTHSKFFALLTLVFGAVSGVGIWFTIGLVSPEATSSLIHTFVWGWAIEWVFFFVEIAAAIIYAFSWDRLDARAHMTIGWIYFVAAWASLFIINGIITYMLTPGAWLQTREFWDGFFNPTYFPSLFMRSAVAVGLAGMFGLVTALRLPRGVRETVVRWSGQWILIGFLLLPLFGWWYYRNFPVLAREYVAGAVTAAQHAARLGVVLSVLTLVLALVLAVWKPRLMNRACVALILLLGLGVMGAGEYLREFVRKPYVISQFIYGNGIRVAALAGFQEDGVAAQAKWLRVEEPAADPLAYGRDLFVLQCSACHTLDGYRPLRPRVRGWDREFAWEMLQHLPALQGAMPPFAGNEPDRAALGEILASLNALPVLPRVTPANELAVGRQVFDIRCGSCHTPDGYFRPLKPSLAPMTTEDIEAMLEVLPVMSENMPPFLGTEEEGRALGRWLASLNP